MIFANSYISEIVLSEVEIQGIVQALGVRMTHDYQGKQPLLVGVLEGSIPFLADLIKRISLPVRVAYLKVSLYGEGLTPRTTANIVPVSAVNFAGEDVILIDDMCDSGKTLQYVALWLVSQGARSVKTAVLLRREGACFIPDYVGSERQETDWFVGYGFDYKGILRNLPYVALLKHEHRDEG